jgi:hypothetical protein
MGRGVATLARLSRAPTLPVGAGWVGERIQILVGAELAPPATAEEERDWLGRYVAWVDRWSRLAPENLPALECLYDWIEHR